MANYIKIQTQRLEQDRDAIQDDMGAISALISELYEEMQLLGETWEGPAWHAFQNQVAEDIENMQMIHDKMKQYLSHMEYACREYRQCEKQISSLVDSIRV